MAGLDLFLSLTQDLSSVKVCKGKFKIVPHELQLPYL